MLVKRNENGTISSHRNMKTFKRITDMIENSERYLLLIFIKNLRYYTCLTLGIIVHQQYGISFMKDMEHQDG